MTGRHSRPRSLPIGAVWSTTLALTAVTTLLSTVITLSRPVVVAGQAINGSVGGSIVTPDTDRLANAAEPAARPVRLWIAKIGVSSELTQLGRDETGALKSPGSPNVAGWFANGPVPGDAGPAIVAGHVDSPAGPGVFYQLRTLQLGDRISVERSDGRTVVFSVTSVRVFPQEQLPVTEVYGPTAISQLRLVTCGGPANQIGGRPLDNILVQAVAVP
jgi:Sortase domain